MELLPTFCKLKMSSNQSLTKFKSLLSQFNIPHFQTRDENETEVSFQPVSIGLINDTWTVTIDPSNSTSPQYVLQRINHEVFRNPKAIDHNNRMLLEHVSQYHPNELFPRLIPLWNLSSPSNHQTLLFDESSKCYFRLYDYIPNSYSVQVLETVEQAYTAAKAFGSFCRIFSTPSSASKELLKELQDTIPNFHNLTLRYNQYQEALIIGLPERIAIAKDEILVLQSMEDILTTYNSLTTDSDFGDRTILRKRVTHHDCKISNMLFEKSTNEGKCVIDLDTTMSGYFISDLGDMFRTFLPACSEEETDLSKVSVRLEYFKAIVDGYLSEMKEILQREELEYVVFAGQFVIYMQTLRFLTDYLLGDVYYKVDHSEHNLNRARNQLKLLQSYRTSLPSMNSIVDNLVNCS